MRVCALPKNTFFIIRRRDATSVRTTVSSRSLITPSRAVAGGTRARARVTYGPARVGGPPQLHLPRLPGRGAGERRARVEPALHVPLDRKTRLNSSTPRTP